MLLAESWPNEDVDEDVKRLILAMVSEDPDLRPTIEEVTSHVFFQERS